jgi:hypothetical protein
MQGSDVGLATGYPDFFRGAPQSVQANTLVPIPRIGYKSCLPHPSITHPLALQTMPDPEDGRPTLRRIQKTQNELTKKQWRGAKS